MTTLKRLLALLMALAMCFALCACNSSTEDPSDSPSADTTNTDNAESPAADPEASGSPAVEEDIEVDLTQTMYEFCSGLKDSDTAVTVNGVAVPNELYFYWLSYDCYYMDYYYYQMGTSANFSDTSLTAYLFSDVQTAVTYYEVLRQLCQSAGVTITEDQLAEYQAMVDQTVAESYNGDYALFYKGYGLSEESLRYIYENNYLYNNYATQVLPAPTEKDLEQYVSDNGIFGVKHILLGTTSTDITDEEGSVTQTADEYNAAQKALAEDLLAQLEAADDQEALFDQLMAEYSEDGRDAEGNLAAPDGYTFSDSDSLAEGFREATLELDVGEISGVVETDYGYHIMLRLPVDAAAYHDALLASQLDAIISEAMESAEVVVADDLANLDVADFYNRYMAYGVALYEANSDSMTTAAG